MGSGSNRCHLREPGDCAFIKLSRVSTQDYREPTNDELWAQPPAVHAPASPAGQYPTAQPQQVAALPVMQVVASPAPRSSSGVDKTHLTLAIVSLALGVPLSAIGAGTVGVPGLVIAWVGIVLVNFFYGKYHRP